MTEITTLDLEAMSGYVLLEFGASWCEYCQQAQSNISAALSRYPDVQHIKIEDGKGMRLGRLYLVKLWPTLIVLNQGKEVNRLVRPRNTIQITSMLDLARD